MPNTITLIAVDKYNRVRAESTWQVTTRLNRATDARERWYKLIGGHGYDFGSFTGLRKLPVGEPWGIVAYEWPMHWTEREAI